MKSNGLPQRVLKSLMKEHRHRREFCSSCRGYTIVCGYCGNNICNGGSGGMDQEKYQRLFGELQNKYLKKNTIFNQDLFDQEWIKITKDCQIPCPDSCQEAEMLDRYLKLNLFQTIYEKLNWLPIQIQLSYRSFFNKKSHFNHIKIK